MISLWVLRMLLIECGSLTDTGIVIRCAPASNAICAYFKFGTSTATRRPAMVSACATTSAQSDICGSAFGETNEPTSISRSPALASAAIQRFLSAVGMARLRLCSPSRGPTSLTSTSVLSEARTGFSCRFSFWADYHPLHDKFPCVPPGRDANAARSPVPVVRWSVGRRDGRVRDRPRRHLSEPQCARDRAVFGGGHHRLRCARARREDERARR